jgi:isopropylmalate/homocitrate/citramalate synthase
MALFDTLPKRVRVVEVGPRDGLQNEKAQIPTAAKIQFIDLLSAAGFDMVEATSFVSPRAIPQLADAGDVMAGIARRAGVSYPVLVPNQKGMERALAAGAQAIAVFTASSETFTQHNINATIAESLENFRPVLAMARGAGVPVRGYISTVFGCPYEGAVSPARVLDVAERLLALGVDELSLGDTIGVATPNQVVDVVTLLAGRVPLAKLALHFHDTRGTALANVLTGLQLGITTYDSSAGGLGGCPYAPGAAGNLATEDLLYLLRGLGIETGIDLEKVVEATSYLSSWLGHAPTSKYWQAATANG